MRAVFAPLLGSALVTCFLLVGTVAAAEADRVAIQGYDTVAYFTDGKPVKGDAAYSYKWADAEWWFANATHRELFTADPDGYMPQFGGFCSAAIRGGVQIPANPEAWAIVDGKLYMVAGTHEDLVAWQADAATNIQIAEEEWRKLQKQ